MTQDFSIGILIPSYNGLALLQKHLPKIIEFSPKNSQIVVVDDGSTDATVDWLAQEHPRVLCIHNDSNLGYTKAINIGLSQIHTDLVLLLNNDCEPLEGYLKSAIKYFSDDKVFAVTLNEIHSSWPVAVFTGKLNYTRSEDKSQPYYSCWASGGSAIFRKKLFDKLGGMDEVFSPGYWEDIDLGYRAWKAGYQIIFDPNSKVVHEHESSFNKFDRKYLLHVKQRNELIFNWKNFTDISFRLRHLFYIVSYTLLHPGYLRVILSAALTFHKSKPVDLSIRTDQEVFNLINRPLYDK